VAARPGPSKNAGRLLEARLREERRAAARTELALAGDRVAVAVRAERRQRVVHVQALETAHADDLRVLVHELAELVGGPDVESRRLHVAGVEADGAGRVLEEETAVVRLGQPGYPPTTQTAVISR
jgi:hypothetical protein